jgi:hypothetical protein
MLQWLADELKAILLWFWDALLSGLAVMIESIPVPSFLQSTNFVIPPSVSWVAEAFLLDVGVGLIVAAYTLRFIVKRLPVVG